MEKIELKPASVFHYFDEICQVPRPSKKEEKIIAYLMDFARRLEEATLDTIRGGIMTGDLARIASPPAQQVLDSWQFIDAIAKRL